MWNVEYLPNAKDLFLKFKIFFPFLNILIFKKPADDYY